MSGQEERKSFPLTDRSGSVPPALADIPGLHEAEFRVERPCVYFLSRGDQVRYVGQTACLQTRLEQHRNTKDFDRVFFIDVPEASLTTVEGRYYGGWLQEVTS